MHRRPRWVVRLLAAGLLASVACGASPERAAPGAVSEQSRPVEARSGVSDTLDIDAIFPPGPGRELVLNNCTNCHNITPIVTLQMTRDAWALNSREHRERVAGLDDAGYAELYEYLAANFNPDRPVPQLPKALLEQWTSY
jgi:hypothetical protein